MKAENCTRLRRAAMATKSSSLSASQGSAGPDDPCSRDTDSGQDYWARWATQGRCPSQSQDHAKPSKETSTLQWLLHVAVLRPDSKLAFWWLGFVSVAVTYNYFAVILRLAFKEMNDKVLFTLLDILSDAVYLMDVAVQSRLAYLDNGCWVMEAARIQKHYRQKRKFTLDCLAIVPLASILDFFAGSRFPLFFRLIRLLKCYTVPKFFEISDCRANSPNFIRACKLSLYLWLVIHWIGCFYYIVSECEGLGSNEWVYPSGEFYDVFIRKYIRCLFWSTMTLTTIGERPPPVTDFEFVFTGATFLIGVFVFAAVVGNVVDVIRNRNASRHDFQRRLDQIKRYLNHRRVPECLQDRVKRWADYTWARTQAIDDRSVLQLLPDRLRTEVAIHVHLDTLKKVKIFEQCEEGFLRELVLKLRPQIFSPGDFICRAGEIGKEMYILNHGRVEVLVPSAVGGEGTRVAVLSPGNYFGEISLLKLDSSQDRAASCRRTADVRAVGFSELLCLSRRDLMAALTDYPAAKRILEAQGRARMEHTREVKNGLTGDSTSDTDSTNVRGESLRPPHKGQQRHSSASGMFRKSVLDVMEGLRERTAQNENSVTAMKTMIQEVLNGQVASLSQKVWTLQRRLALKEGHLRRARRTLVVLQASPPAARSPSPAITSPWVEAPVATTAAGQGGWTNQPSHRHSARAVSEEESECRSHRSVDSGNSPQSGTQIERKGDNSDRRVGITFPDVTAPGQEATGSRLSALEEEGKQSSAFVLEERREVAQPVESTETLTSLRHRRLLLGNPRSAIKRQRTVTEDALSAVSRDDCQNDGSPV